MGPVIGDKLLRLDYQGGEGKPKRSRWKHKSGLDGATVIGLTDGSVFLKRGTKPLWGMFE